MILKNILQLYALVICTVTIIILFIISGLSLNSITNLILPEYTNYSSMQRYGSNEAYIEFRENRYDAEKDDIKTEIIRLKQLPPQALAEKRTNEKMEFLENNRRMNIERLITYFQWAIVSLLFFFVHWRIYKKQV